MSRDLEDRLDRAVKAGDRTDARKTAARDDLIFPEPTVTVGIGVMTPVATGTLDTRAGTDMAYVAVLEGPSSGREKFGYYLGIAVRGDHGYRQLKPGFGPYRDQKEADEHAAELNRKLGHPDEKSAAILVAETMRPELGRRTRRR